MGSLVIHKRVHLRSPSSVLRTLLAHGQKAYCWQSSHKSVRPYSMDFPSEASQLNLTLEEERFNRWGWVIYRTTYGDPQAWDGFQRLITEWVRKSVAQTDVPSLLDRLELTFFDDAAAFKNASRHQLREHFRQWSLKTGPNESPQAEFVDGAPETPRYEYFFQVDEEALNSIKSLGPLLSPVDARAHVKFIQAAWQPMGKDGEAPENEEPYEEIDGVREEDVGWIKVRLSWLSYSSYLLMSGPLDTWPNMYQRPPALVEY